MKQSKNLTTGLMTSAVADAWKTSYNMVSVPRLIADWNLNRFTIPSADNVPPEDTEGFDIEAFPISSIIEPIRPTKGIAKARLGESVVSSTYQNPTDPKFYTGDRDDVYKYWTSPYPTNGSGVFPNHTDGATSARPFVAYPVVFQSNKIVIKLENTWASPNSYNIKIRTTVGGAWSAAISTNPTIANDGTVTLYYNGSAWVQTKPATLVKTAVAGIMLTVNTLTAGRKRDGTVMTYQKATYDIGSPSTWGALTTTNTTGANSSLNVIAIEAHREEDLTSRLINVSDNFDMSEASQLYPIGTITTNQGDIQLSNEDGIFDIENSGGTYYGLLEPGVEFNLEYIYTIASVQHSVQQFKLTGGAWAPDDGVVNISLNDASDYLKTVKPLPMLCENKSVTEVIWRVLDSVGFIDYDIDTADTLTDHVIPFFWTTGDETVWEVLDEISKASQTAIYFDCNNRLQVKTRQAAFRQSEGIDLTLLGQKVSSDLANIVELTPQDNFEANKIDVKYRTTAWAVNTRGMPALAKVWEPDGDTLVVRSSQIRKSITGASTAISIDQADIKLWPWKSKVLIDGELIQYEGKRFQYYTGPTGTVSNIITVKSAAEQAKYHKMTPADYRFKNQFTGGLEITERGVWNTEIKDHLVDTNGWTTKQEVNGTVTSDVRGFSLNPALSTGAINTPYKVRKPSDVFWVTQGQTVGTPYKMYGTKMKFVNDAASTTQRGGMAFFLSGSREDGYYVELALTNSFNATERKTRAEVTLYSRVSGEFKLIEKGRPIAITKGIFYELDAYVNVQTQHGIRIFLNGQMVINAVTTAPTKQTPGGRQAMYARGRSRMDYEYFYAVARSIKEPIDDFGFYDLKYGGVRGGMWEKELVYTMGTRWYKLPRKGWTKVKARYNQYFFDEFGPYMHEVREFDVKFNESPVQYSYLFNTNQWYSTIVEYAASPFGAKFVVANTGREHAILQGEDRLLYAGSSASVNQVCTVLGRTLQIDDEETVTVKNEAKIRTRGPIEAELSSDWIQNKEMAQDLADWMGDHWSDGVDEVDVEIYANPLIEIGDIMAIDFDRLHMDAATHKYFVVRTATSFESGPTTTLTLRRARTPV